MSVLLKDRPLSGPPPAKVRWRDLLDWLLVIVATICACALARG